VKNCFPRAVAFETIADIEKSLRKMRLDGNNEIYNRKIKPSTNSFPKKKKKKKKKTMKESRDYQRH